MKLAEALSLRKDLEKKISGLKERLENVVRVQEGDEPVESPEELMTELDNCLGQLELLIYNINMTNMKVVDEDGKSMTKLLAERDVLNKRITILRSAFERFQTCRPLQLQRNSHGDKDGRQVTSSGTRQVLPGVPTVR